MANNKWICWWNYFSFWKLFGICFLCVILSVLCAIVMPNAWCLCAIIPICGVGGYGIRKIIPYIFRDLAKEIEKN